MRCDRLETVTLGTPSDEAGNDQEMSRRKKQARMK